MPSVRKYKSNDLERLVTLIDGSTEGVTPYNAFKDHESLLRFAVNDKLFHVYVISDNEDVMGLDLGFLDLTENLEVKMQAE